MTRILSKQSHRFWIEFIQMLVMPFSYSFGPVLKSFIRASVAMSRRGIHRLNFDSPDNISVSHCSSVICCKPLPTAISSFVSAISKGLLYVTPLYIFMPWSSLRNVLKWMVEVHNWCFVKILAALRPSLFVNILCPQFWRVISIFGVLPVFRNLYDLMRWYTHKFHQLLPRMTFGAVKGLSAIRWRHFSGPFYTKLFWYLLIYTISAAQID